MSIFFSDYCYICQERIRPDISWKALFSPEKEPFICTDCRGKFERIEGETCRICSRPFQQIDNPFRDEDVCYDCIRWEEDPEWQGVLKKNTSIFVYNEFLKAVIAKFKYRGDYMLAKVFSEMFRKKVQGLVADVFVPIPLSEERLYERGFNQAEAILTEAGLQPSNILTRIHTEKQSKKSRTERIHLPQVFQLLSNPQIEGKKIVLIDDIYTTGSTLRHAAKLLKYAGATTIQSITIGR
ncbi:MULTISPECIES: ComF family protein [Neobacillus]|uniref:ComF family protein n=1 Tax=Neobacillus sedimentimangrovi TaxID=2699460 RepID=A0ABS8QFS4_9BACI|nr:ComF family protein [Neobacillus sedimentimangrovi]AIM16225.1 phosphoribosyltransferase [Bacillus sp. X1(2014)]MCD4838016.1 ComF family protein [Neobacillus sedimentimangrovi]